MKLKMLFLVLASGLILGGCKKDAWTGAYEKTTDNRIYTSMEFSTPQQCSNWLAEERQKESIHPTGRFNFECGLNCESKGSLNVPLQVCEKTFDN